MHSNKSSHTGASKNAQSKKSIKQTKRNNRKNSTLKDLEKATGVSKSTISRVFNNPDKVKSSTLKLVRKKANELGYQPSRVAQRLQAGQGKAKVIGLIIPDIMNPFFAEITRGIEDVALKNGYALILNNSNENLTRQRLCLDTLRMEGVDGIILPPVNEDDDYVKELFENGLNIVCIDRVVKDAPVDSILSDNRKGAYMAVSHLISLGHNKQENLWKNGLRGRKRLVYENGIRVPMFIKLPGSTGPGERLNDRASIEDIMPTILDVCGLSTPAQMDGLSLVPLLSEEPFTLPERTFFYQFHRGLHPEKCRNVGVVRGSYKLVQPVGSWRFSFSLDTMRFELYDLDEDPFELNDISDIYPEIVAGLKDEYEAWFADVTSSGFDPVPTWIGAEGQGVVLLTRQDWRGGGLFDEDLGYYEIDVRTAGNYRITCTWSQLFNETHPATLRIGEQELKKDILYAEAQYRFDEVYLPVGRSQLEAWVEIDGKKNGFRFIEIEKLADLELFESVRKDPDVLVDMDLYLPCTEEA